MAVQQISSRKNEYIKDAVHLITSGDYRKEQGLFLAEGARLCSDASQSGVKILKTFFTRSAQEKYGNYLSAILSSSQECYSIESHIAQVLSSTKTSQGIFCVCKMPEQKDVSSSHMKISGKYIALENLQDPGNVGAVFRTAEAIGLNGVLLCGSCCDIYSPKVLRASMGAIFRIPVFQEETLPIAAEKLQERGFCFYAAVPDNTAKNVLKCNFSQGSIMAIGNEGNGLSEEAIKACTQKITIPMLGRAESLNAACSAAILMWEMVREELL